jgi:hypothetical protein
MYQESTRYIGRSQSLPVRPTAVRNKLARFGQLEVVVPGGSY